MGVEKLLMAMGLIFAGWLSWKVIKVMAYVSEAIRFTRFATTMFLVSGAAYGGYTIANPPNILNWIGGSQATAKVDTKPITTSLMGILEAGPEKLAEKFVNDLVKPEITAQPEVKTEVPSITAVEQPRTKVVEQAKPAVEKPKPQQRVWVRPREIPETHSGQYLMWACAFAISGLVLTGYLFRMFIPK